MGKAFTQVDLWWIALYEYLSGCRDLLVMVDHRNMSCQDWA